jgi:hypothetical protein
LERIVSTAPFWLIGFGAAQATVDGAWWAIVSRAFLFGITA